MSGYSAFNLFTSNNTASATLTVFATDCLLTLREILLSPLYLDIELISLYFSSTDATS